MKEKIIGRTLPQDNKQLFYIATKQVETIPHTRKPEFITFFGLQSNHDHE